MATKTAAKQTVAKLPREYIQNFREVEKNLMDLELDLKKLKKKIDGLCQHPYIIGPKQPKSE